MSFDNTNSGMLAANERKRGDKDPSHTGMLNVDGVDYWVSAWVNEGKLGSKIEGKKYFSLRLKRKDQQVSNQGSQPSQQAIAANATLDFDDSIPF